MINIQKARFEDLEDILELQQTAYLSEAELYKEIVIPPLIQTISEIQEEYITSVFYKIVSHSKMIGSVRVSYSNDTCNINKLCVHPRHQGQGIGRLMMREVENVMDCRRFELFTGHRSTRNLNFYESLGYRRFKQEPQNEALTLIYLVKFKDM